jgi:putative tricarboxylic transport membrane protein
MLYGLQPGPLLFEQQPVFVWTVIASMYIGNVILLILNLPFVGIWAKMVKVPYYIIGPVILILCFIGTYSVRNSIFDVAICLAFGIIGLLLEKLEIPLIPLSLALILTPMMETSLRQTISMGGGSLAVFLDRPIALSLIAVGILAMAFTVYLRRRWARAGVRDLV